ncbi:hypothetical protein HPB48_003000 [Haemaphysalis longicornis]|uniref:Amidase n=1 Tax=Haemaphysalis longicornis TaxID=44386 RepID=A0A9J6FDT9_HAELO|nr:hypothetical protein HPB48_003000 [Haemaphysalis longicornis]
MGGWFMHGAPPGEHSWRLLALLSPLDGAATNDVPSLERWCESNGCPTAFIAPGALCSAHVCFLNGEQERANGRGGESVSPGSRLAVKDIIPVSRAVGRCPFSLSPETPLPFPERPARLVEPRSGGWRRVSRALAQIREQDSLSSRRCAPPLGVHFPVESISAGVRCSGCRSIGGSPGSTDRHFLLTGPLLTSLVPKYSHPLRAALSVANRPFPLLLRVSFDVTLTSSKRRRGVPMLFLGLPGQTCQHQRSTTVAHENH